MEDIDQEKMKRHLGREPVPDKRQKCEALYANVATSEEEYLTLTMMDEGDPEEFVGWN